MITTPFLKRRVPGSTRGVHSTPLLDEKSWTKGIRGPLLDKHTSTPICVRWEYPSGRSTYVLGSFNQGVSRHVHWGPAVSGLRCNIGRAECLTAPTLVSSGRRWQPISLSSSSSSGPRFNVLFQVTVGRGEPLPHTHTSNTVRQPLMLEYHIHSAPI